MRNVFKMSIQITSTSTIRKILCKERNEWAHKQPRLYTVSHFNNAVDVTKSIELMRWKLAYDIKEVFRICNTDRRMKRSSFPSSTLQKYQVKYQSQFNARNTHLYANVHEKAIHLAWWVSFFCVIHFSCEILILKVKWNSIKTKQTKNCRRRYPKLAANMDTFWFRCFFHTAIKMLVLECNCFCVNSRLVVAYVNIVSLTLLH